MHTTSSRSVLRIVAYLFAAIACLVAIPAHAQNQHASTAERCFNETGYCISGRIREYWEQNGGLPVFGFPISPQQEELVEGQPFRAQWFERHRLELHPENPRPYDVLLGRLGARRFEQSGTKAAPESARAGCQFFAQTSFNVCGRFLDAWRADGLEFDGRSGKTYAENLALFGLPLSNEQSWQSSGGETWTVQWFERARFEHHPENQPPYDVLFGLLGNETYSGQPTRTGEIVFVSDRDGNDEIYVMNADGSNQQRLTDDVQMDSEPTWSPDGSKIAFTRFENNPIPSAGRSELYVMHADGSNPTKITSSIEGSVRSFAWSPDNRKFVLSVGSINADLVVINADGSNATPIASGRPNDFNPAWSPDGTKLTFLSDRDQNQAKPYVMNADGSNPIKISDETTFEQPVWTPDRRTIVFAASNAQPGVFRANSDGSGVTTLLAASGYVSELVLSPDGVRIAYSVASRNSQNVPVSGTLWVASYDGSGAAPRAGTDVTAGTTASDPTWSPNGPQMAWTQSCFQSSPGDACSIGTNIFVIDANGGNQRQLTQNSGRNFAPNWRQR